MNRIYRIIKYRIIKLKIKEFPIEYNEYFEIISISLF